ncbi:MAG: OmpA family protein [Spirochaetaceae bacterium]|jgi:outer membrane protein OmpA-like peptidoglycan-associated protein|nr:OmpA family protein [Spirochaetaceae bacterium]
MKHLQKILGITLALVCVEVQAEEFAYKHETGDKYRILSTVREDVFVNRRFSHRSEILNRIAVEVRSVTNGVGSHGAVFQTAERGVAPPQTASQPRQPAAQQGPEHFPGNFQWAKEYESEFDRDRLGYVQIDKKYYMPVVRNVPVFPNRDLKPGDTWSAEGHEMHDFRASFGITEPYRIPFTANYTFLGNREWQGKEYPAFSVSYRIFSEPEASSGTMYPTRITGESDQIVYWNPALGQPAAYQEYFRMIFELSNGMTMEFRGDADAEILESESMDKPKITEDILEDINRLDIPDISVRQSDEGIVISLEDIQFQADSANLMPGEQDKLNKIAEILLRYKDRDIMVGGHTALAGTAEGRQQLSEERASSVAEYLIKKAVRPADRVVIQGYGAERPVADNSTPEGRRRNRRVEITILEN